MAMSVVRVVEMPAYPAANLLRPTVWSSKPRVVRPSIHATATARMSATGSPHGMTPSGLSRAASGTACEAGKGWPGSERGPPLMSQSMMPTAIELSMIVEMTSWTPRVVLSSAAIEAHMAPKRTATTTATMTSRAAGRSRRA